MVADLFEMFHPAYGVVDIGFESEVFFFGARSGAGCDSAFVDSKGWDAPVFEVFSEIFEAVVFIR